MHDQNQHGQWCPALREWPAVLTDRMLSTGMIPGFFMGNSLMWHDLLVALALLLVIEGIWPFLSPNSMREVLLMLAQQDSRSLRISGLISMVSGVILLYLVN
jgi:uncharacterized protein YjeT (DUF2065 family)